MRELALRSPLYPSSIFIVLITSDNLSCYFKFTDQVLTHALTRTLRTRRTRPPEIALPDVVWPAAAKQQPRARSGYCRPTGAASIFNDIFLNVKWDATSGKNCLAKPVYLCARVSNVRTVASRPARARAARAIGLCRLNKRLPSCAAPLSSALPSP